ncbi:MAG: Thiamine-phosphate synthase [Elusimicrobia bacterium ADurb.Bin231]|nr:MAG: Thiamine-phosphate synthase [Elusimicrobia bacterium ADurb.Bin231]
MNIKGYYFITDSILSKAGNLSDIKNAILAGTKVIQYRNKTGTSKELYEEAIKIKNICSGVIFLVNDRIDIALAVDAAGAHLGQDDIPLKTARRIMGGNKIIGVTVHNVPEAIEAENNGADYLGVSPVFHTGTKPDAGAPAGIELIKEIKKVSKLPVAAIGGINLSNAFDVVSAGADAVCAISAVVSAADVKCEIEKFQRLFY